MYSSLSCSWSFSCRSLSCILYSILANMSMMSELLLCCPELPTGSWLHFLSSGDKFHLGLRLFCLFSLLLSMLSTIACSGFSILLSSSSTTSCNFFLPLFDGALVISVNVRGEVLGHLSSSSQVTFTPPNMQSLVIVVGCGIKPLYLLW